MPQSRRTGRREDKDNRGRRSKIAKNTGALSTSVYGNLMERDVGRMVASA
jgi:hypothetical protein